MSPYQDVWREGKRRQKGYRETESRYEAIKESLQHLRRPFTVLDVGAAGGYFSARLAEDFNAVCTAVDNSPSLRDYPGVTTIRQRLSPAEIRELGTFDVVLGLSLLHHQTDWRETFKAMEEVARSALIIETPHPAEQLKQAPARKELDKLDKFVGLKSLNVIGTAPSVYRSDLRRKIYFINPQPLVFWGEVFAGNGNNSALTKGLEKELERVLGYQPYPGSLNVRINLQAQRHRFPKLLGPPVTEFVDPKRGRGGKRGGDYQYWHAVVKAVNSHVMIPGLRGHGDDVLEIVSPLGLRDVLHLHDGQRVPIMVGAH